MDNLTFPLLWCVVQVTILSILGLIGAIATTKHGPQVAAKIAGWVALVALTVTSLIPVSIPSSFASNTLFNVVPKAQLNLPEQPRVPAYSVTNQTEFHPDDRASESSASFPFNPALLLMQLTNQPQPAEVPAYNIRSFILIGIGMGISFGVAKLILGLVLLGSLRRRAASIEDDNFLSMAQEMIVKTACQQPILFAASPEIDCAAVVGFFRPTILLSSRWMTWSDEEQQAVVAHELAHIYRHDAFWRFVATVCQIVHFYNPLTRWLMARLVLAQELAADQIAVPRVGGAGVYLRSLSRLALEHDARPLVRSHLSITPVFSGYLMRRVEMLRAMDCQHGRSSRRWLSWAIIFSIALFGVATTAMRGFAEAEKQEQTKSTGESAKGSNNVSAEFVDKFAGSFDPEAFFQGKKIPATDPAFRQSGAFQLDLSALRRKKWFPIFRTMLNADGLSDKLTTHWDFDALDVISADAISRVKAGSENKSSLTDYTATALRFKTNRDVIWRSSIRLQFPDSLEGKNNGVEYLDAKLPSNGMPVVRLHPVNPRELVLFMKPEQVNLKKRLDPWADQPPPDWSDEWDAVSGGVLAVSMVIPQFEEAATFRTDVGAEQNGLICQNVDQVSFGLDISDDSSKLAIKVRLRCRESADPEQVLTAAKDLLQLYKVPENMTGNHLPNEPWIIILNQSYQTLCTAYGSAKTEIVRGKRIVIESRMESTASPKLLEVLASENAKTKKEPDVKQAANREDSSTTIK